MADTLHWKVAFRYVQYDRRWWEVFGNNFASMPQVIATLTAVTDAAQAFRHPACYISHARISNPFVRRQSKPVHIRNNGQTIGSTLPEITSTAAIYEFAGLDIGVKRAIWIRGLKENNVKRVASTGQDSPQGDLDQLVKAYFNILRANGYGIPNLQPVDSGANARHAIKSITVDALGAVKVNTDEAFVFGDRKRMIIYKVDEKLFPGINGKFKVSGDATGFTLHGYRSHLAAATYPMFGPEFRKEEYRFTAFAENGATFLAFDRRDTAGGPLLTRGRQRSKTLRSR